MNTEPRPVPPTRTWVSLDQTIRYYKDQNWRIWVRDFPQVLYRRTGLRFYLLSPSRMTHMLVARGLLPKVEARNEIEPLEQYAVAFSRLNKDSVVYSVGVGDNIYFDQVLADRVGCRVHLFDPTPIAVNFMKTVHRSELVFHPTAIWTHDGSLEMFVSCTTDTERVAASVTNQFQTTTRIEVPSKTIATVMRELGHTHVDLLKLDIEGGALAVLEDLLAGPIRPKQIVMELERPVEATKSVEYWVRLVRLMKSLRRTGYSSYLISDKKGIGVEIVSIHEAVRSGC